MIEELAEDSGLDLPTIVWKDESWGPNGQWSEDGGGTLSLNEGLLDDPRLVHDVQPWRTQQVYLEADGGPVVVTAGTEAMGDGGDLSWTRPAEGKALLQLVEDVLAGSSGPVTTATPAAPAPEPVASERVVTETAWWLLTGWRWLVPGLVLGAAGVLLLTRGRSRDREPRQVLVDVSP